MALFGCAALAQAPGAFPARPVRVIVPYPAGGTTDVIARIVAEKLSAKWGQNVLIDNRTGAGGNIGAELAARAEPDGYTLLCGAPGPLAINSSLYRQLGYDPLRFSPISVLATMPTVLVTRGGLAAESVQELIALAKREPGRLTYASQGSGTTSHLTASLFESTAGVKLTHVPYKGSTPALTDMIGGQVDIMFDNVTSSLAFYRAGRVKFLAIATLARVPFLPNVPTMSEAGLPGFHAGTWVATVAPPNAPPAVTAQIAGAMAEAVRLPDVQKRFAELGADPVGSSPPQMKAFVAEEAARWRKVIEQANVTLQ